MNKFVAKFNLKLTEDDEIKKINRNQRKRIESHRQERKGYLILRKADHKEEIINFSLTISNMNFQDFSMTK